MTTDILAFLEQWRHARGRALHVLHIGNIANNAYNNAKIQRRYGIEADVLSFDYYHIMACPEWEDADFEGEIADDMFPDWWAVDLRGFERPRWFAQGPFDISIRYLLAKTKGSCHSKLALGLVAVRALVDLQEKRFEILHYSAHRPPDRTPDSICNCPRQCYFDVLGGELACDNRTSVAMDEEPSSTAFSARCPATYHPGANGRRRWRCTTPLEDDEALQTFCRNQLPQHELTTIDRSDRFDDIGHFYRVWFHPYLPLLLDRYDIVQCYATYTALPFIVQRNYMAYEHGTIRSIPFLKTDEGRMCAATYRAAKTAFITNSDNLDAAARLRLDRVVVPAACFR